MSTYPVLWPTKQGPGRITRLFAITVDEYESVKDKTYLFVLSPVAKDVEKFLLLVDAPLGDENTTIKGNWQFQRCHTQMLNTFSDIPNAQLLYTIELPGSTATTPKSGYYLCNLMKSPPQNHKAICASLDAYLRGIFYCGVFDPVFHHIAVTHEDPEIVISFQGWPNKAAGQIYWDVSQSGTCALP
jgi:hypothetical protein